MNGTNVESDACDATSEMNDPTNTHMNPSHTANMDELIAQVRKPEHQNVRGWSVMRLLHPFQDRLTRMLIGTRVASWHLTVTWFLLSLVSYSVSAVGLPETFLAGAIILFIAIVVDLCDGEIGRARGRQMSDEEDLRSFIKGMFLDRMCHTICTPLWPMAVAWGLYNLHEQAYQQAVVLVAGLSLTAYHTACRGLPHLEAYLAIYFRDRVLRSFGHQSVDAGFSRTDQSSRVFARLGRKIELWVRNGKRFNFMILSASIADVVIAQALGLDYCWVLWTGFVTYGVASLVLLIVMLVSRVRGSYLVDRTISSIQDDKSRGN